MPYARKDHGNAMFVGGINHLLIAHRATGLNHRTNAGFRRRIYTIAKREKRI
jgi:hypothetical protein